MDVIVDGLTRRFRQEHDLGGLSDDQLFETFAAFCTIRRYYEGDLKPDDCRTGGQGDHGVDAAAVIVNGRLFTDPRELKDSIADQNLIDPRFVVVQARSSVPFAADTFTMLAANLRLVFSPNPIQGPTTPELARFRQCVDVVYADKMKLRPDSPILNVFYVAPGNPKQEALAGKRIQAIGDLRATGLFADVDMEAIGVEAIRTLYHQAYEPVKASIKMTGFMPLPVMDDIDQAHLGVLSARELVDNLLIDSRGHIRPRLFYDNVRGYLQLRNPVNEQMHKSLENDAQRKRFAVMNNGITIVTRDLRITGHQFDLRDFHVVNGCQTCHVLVHNRSNLDDSTNVTVRIIVTRQREVVDDVVRATNSQTTVAATSFDARLPFQKQLEDYFGAQHPPRQLLYERRIGQFGTGKIAGDTVPITLTLAASGAAGLPRSRIMQPAQVARAFISAFKREAWKASGTGATPERAIFKSSADPMPFYVAASMLFQAEHLLDNRKLPAMFRPAKYHMVAAAKGCLVGPEPLPTSGPRRSEYCKKMLDIIWVPSDAEELFEKVMDVLLKARDAAQPGGDAFFNATLVRSKLFGEHVLRIATELIAKE